MPNIFEYEDYRKYLEETIRERKRTFHGFSHRYIGAIVGFSPGYLSRVLAGEKKMSAAMVLRFAEFLKLRSIQAEYFETMVNYCQAGTQNEKQVYYQRMLKLRPAGVAVVSSDKFEFYSSWRHTALRALLSIHPVTDASDMKRIGAIFTPALSAREVRESIDLLCRLGLAKRNEDGVYCQCDQFISSGDLAGEVAVQQFLKSVAQLAVTAHGLHDPTQRAYSSLSFTVSEKGKEAIAEKIAQFRQEVQQLLRADQGATRVYHLNIQLFPLSHNISKGAQK